MKRSVTCCLLFAVILMTPAWLQGQKSGGIEKAVAALELKWLDAIKANNADLVAPLMADKIVDTTSEGKVMDKAEALKTAKATKYTSAAYDGDVKVTVFGNAAIATGVFSGRGTDPSGKAFDVHERWTDTWVRMTDGKWQCVATQSTSAKM